MRFGILVVSTTCAQEPHKDLAGPGLIEEIKKTFPENTIEKEIVSDDAKTIEAFLRVGCDSDLYDVIFTVGGTGFSPSDVTPEATKAVIEKEAPGFSYAIMSKSLALTDMAMLSRATSGIRKQTVIINFPGSKKAAVECFGFVKSSLSHAVALLRNQINEVKRVHEAVQSPSTSSKVAVGGSASRNRISQFPMIEVDEAHTIIKTTLETADFIIELPIEIAVTYVLAEDIVAEQPIPPFRASIKDGYAVRAADGTGQRKVRSVAAAGDAPQQSGKEGEIVRISTGAVIPPGADAVVQVEDTLLIASHSDTNEEILVAIKIPPKIGQDIREVGSDISVGSVVLAKNKRITSAYVGVLAMLGRRTVKVFKRPSIGIISTGNELINCDQPLKPGLIYDSNKITLINLLKRYGYEANDCGIAKDNPNDVKFKLEDAFKQHDLIISSGGVSMGEYDLLKQILMEDFNATIHFGRLSMKPGKPTVFVTLQFKGKLKIVFALPGNPVSCCVTTLLFVVPTLKFLDGEDYKMWPQISATLVIVFIGGATYQNALCPLEEQDIANRDIRPEYHRVTVVDNGFENLIAISTGNQISSRLNSMVDANGLLVVPGQTTFMKFKIVKIFLFEQVVKL